MYKADSILLNVEFNNKREVVPTISARFVKTPDGKIFLFDMDEDCHILNEFVKSTNSFLFYSEGDNTNNPNIKFNNIIHLKSGCYEVVFIVDYHKVYEVFCTPFCTTSG